MQKYTSFNMVRACCLLVAFLLVALSSDAVAADKKKAAVKAPPGMAALPLELPKPAFVGTPQNIKGVKQLEKPLGRPRAAKRFLQLLHALDVLRSPNESRLRQFKRQSRHARRRLDGCFFLVRRDRVGTQCHKKKRDQQAAGPHHVE